MTPVESLLQAFEKRFVTAPPPPTRRRRILEVVVPVGVAVAAVPVGWFLIYVIPAVTLTVAAFAGAYCLLWGNPFEERRREDV